ncbi:hypothetical protein HMPREF1008_01183 [Olsenella sp. oral taxon 809 str. F0356]|mgnify:CR=1 FL=1|uniref:DUF4430 domain-containing protein n=1 Tax=Olsenella sp. oral taxon 809 TaxID=661086 RepID=UPI000231ED6E|nr:DUF4430 domain-containing protein [Olsenella sp. oral taxon 809]EHF01559.1 hypothetical protein HMPREF1008_01183 [Olsenella sp. oral taxon 809 str. F0356]
MSARRQKVVRGALSAASVLVIAFCAWSMSQYARGEDPLASLTAVSGPSLATTQEAAAGSGMAAAASESSSTGEGPASAGDQGESSSEGRSSDTSSETSAAPQDKPAEGSERGSDEPVEGASSDSSAGAPSESTVSAPSADDGLISVTVSVNGSASTVRVREGATAYDALCAVASVDAGANPYGSGSWVYVIDGVGSTDMSRGHGWVYAVDGSSPSVMSDECPVSDGSVVSWSYV